VIKFFIFSINLIVGGIYTVIRTKAQVTSEELGDQYCLVGPYNEQLVRTEVEVEEPADYAFRGAIQALKNLGIRVCSKASTIYQK